MIQLLRTFRIEIEKYCRENNLSTDKVFSSAHCGSKDWVALQHTIANSKRAKLGLLDDVPAPITLEIYLENGRLRFVQTDITRKYLGADREAAKPPAVKRPVVRRLPSRELAPA